MEVADGGEGVVAGGAQLVAWQWDLEWCTQLVLRPNRNQTVYSYDKMHLRIYTWIVWAQKPCLQ